MKIYEKDGKFYTCISAIAERINVGPNMLRATLRQIKFLDKDNNPTPYFVDKGYIFKNHPLKKPKGHPVIGITTEGEKCILSIVTHQTVMEIWAEKQAGAKLQKSQEMIIQSEISAS
jgi:hypothetical protein